MSLAARDTGPMTADKAALRLDVDRGGRPGPCRRTSRRSAQMPNGTATPPSKALPHLRIVLADDHAPFRTALRATLEASQGMQVVAEAEDGLEAVRLCARHRPDVVLLDLAMPVLNGLAATRQILDERPECFVIVLTMSHDSDSVDAAFEAGARGYLLKGTARGPLVAGVRAVASGRLVLGAGIGSLLPRRGDVP
jgi:CheY-like chemotaxis protein